MAATGSIATPGLPAYLSAMRERIGGTYTVLMTHSATAFLPPETVALFADRVVSGESPADWPTDKPSRLVADHDILAVLPATANTLAIAATGAAPSRLGTVILAADFPVVLFPVMGASMWRKPAVQRNVAQIREDGHLVPEPVWHAGFDPVMGRGAPHPALPEPERVAEIVEGALASPNGVPTGAPARAGADHEGMA
ncbi:flavoprotein [Actinomadura sp. KC216]|uniref:flavoprotein n=1 Tax=Actinomadura sp. KC216 TaxID=2530370 RepID=UPI001FB7A1A6|nr:flavoprotein [Actinomadura sp. KC216]